MTIYEEENCWLYYMLRDNLVINYDSNSGFGGLEVSVLASSTRVQTRLKPSDFSGEKILSAPSFRGK